jgi:hypothetical protein
MAALLLFGTSRVETGHFDEMTRAEKSNSAEHADLGTAEELIDLHDKF